MKRWFIGYNDYWYTAGIHLEEVPMVLCFLEWIVDWISVFIPPIKFPRIKFRLRDKEDWDWTENEDGWTTLRDWFGDLRQLYDVYIYHKVFRFIDDHTKQHYFNYPYETLQREFPEIFEEGIGESEDEKEIREREENKRESDRVGKEFLIVIKKLEGLRERGRV